MHALVRSSTCFLDGGLGVECGGGCKRWHTISPKLKKKESHVHVLTKLLAILLQKPIPHMRVVIFHAVAKNSERGKGTRCFSILKQETLTHQDEKHEQHLRHLDQETKTGNEAVKSRDITRPDIRVRKHDKPTPPPLKLSSSTEPASLLHIPSQPFPVSRLLNLKVSL